MKRIIFLFLFISSICFGQNLQNTGGTNTSLSSGFTGILPIANGGTGANLSRGFSFRNSITDVPYTSTGFVNWSGIHSSNTVNATAAWYICDTAVTQGSGVFEIQNLQVRMVGSATGTVSPIALSIGQENTGGGTITAFPSSGTAGSGLASNIGAFLQANGTTSGDNIGSVNRAGNGANNYGSVNIANTNDAKNNYALYAAANSASGSMIGGYFVLGTTLPTAGASGALVCDNGGKSADIFSARISGTKKFYIDNNGVLQIAGATSGTLAIKAAAVAGTNTITFPAGTTDFSATGGAHQYVYQGTSGGALTVQQPSTADISDIATGTFTPTYTGFSANPTIRAYYTKIGKLVTVSFVNDSRGTSNASTFTITNLPYASYSASNFTQQGYMVVSDNGTWQNSGGIWLVTAGSTTVSFGYNSNAGAGGFTSSGAKGATGVIQYLTD